MIGTLLASGKDAVETRMATNVYIMEAGAVAEEGLGQARRTIDSSSALKDDEPAIQGMGQGERNVVACKDLL